MAPYMEPRWNLCVSSMSPPKSLTNALGGCVHILSKYTRNSHTSESGIGAMRYYVPNEEEGGLFRS
jgi:hypothetical protein